MFRAEFQKLLAWRPLLAVLALLLFVNAFFLVRQEQKEKVPASYEQVLWTELANKSDPEKLEYLQQELKSANYYNTDGTVNYDRYILMDRWREQLESILSYSDYVTSIEKRANQFSGGMFPIEKNTFTYRKNAHLPEVYAAVQQITPVFDISDGVVKTAGNRFSDLLCAIFLWITAVLLVIRDREQKTVLLLRSMPNGRRRLLLCRFKIMLALAVGAAAVFFAETLIVCRKYYLFGDLSRPVQSLDGFIGCAMPISVWQYLLICFLMKCLFLFLLGSLFLVLCQTASSNLQLYLETACILGIEYILYQKTTGLLAQYNCFALSDVNAMVMLYQDSNLFGFPFSRFKVSVCFMLILLVCLIGLSVFREESRRNAYRRISVTWNRKSPIRVFVFPRSVYALYHSLIGQKAAYACAALVLVSVFWALSLEKPYEIQDTYYHAYTTQTEGAVTEEVQQFFAGEELRFAEVEEQYLALAGSGEDTVQLHTLEKQLEPQAAMQQLEEHLQQTIRSVGKEHTVIFYDSGYRRLFFNTDQEKTGQLLIIFIVLVFVISPLIAVDLENGMIQIIRSTAFGKRAYYREKILLATAYAAFSACVLWIPYGLVIGQKYTYPSWSAWVQNIRGLEQFPWHISIAAFALVYFFLLFVGIWLAAMGMLLLSRCTRSRLSAGILNSCIFLLPLVLKWMGVFSAV